MRTPPSLPSEFGFDSARAVATINSALGAGRTVLSEIEAKDLLAAYGIPVVQTLVADSPARVEAIARDIIREHGACVIKVLSDDISHKSDVGGVRLDLQHAEEAGRAAQDMLDHIAIVMPAARIKGFTVQAMVRRPRALELLLGMSVDQTFGPLLMFGAGGTSVEIVRDTATGLPPLDLNLARDMMQQTRVWRLMQGYRDRPPVDADGVSEALVRLSYLVSTFRDPRARHQSLAG